MYILSICYLWSFHALSTAKKCLKHPVTSMTSGLMYVDTQAHGVNYPGLMAELGAVPALKLYPHYVFFFSKNNNN